MANSGRGGALSRGLKRKLTGKGKAPALYTHQPAIAQELGVSSDGRHVQAKITVLGSASAAQPTYGADEAAEAALDGLDSSYMLGDDGFPVDNVDEGDRAGVNVVPVRNKNSDIPLRTWLLYRSEYLDKFLDQQCFGGELMCRTCHIKAHQTNPLHWMEEWTGTEFKCTSLQEMGLMVQLGHAPGLRCATREPNMRKMAVIHTNGIHSVSVDFCRCGTQEVDHWRQLMRSCWWPAMPLDPQTSSTFEVLRQFQTINPPPDRCRPFMRTVRQWRNVRMLKRFGRAHDPTGIEGTPLGGLALLCLACPQLEINLLPDWKREPAATA
ncbi:hypothetical protein C8J57DRAFT_1500408 [Mycena rebaudengoi]|nr:hypothetical protein C8J57DRAFT_1500408 [Mycena rebaudengoi]